ncbi:DUF7288 family protein [Natrarchaeobius chitinivorans]|uniref:Uncharacterized protein n=1 Tax=Natrarchaeobius chitinivorans TaxID=1679083 RepID=A0A3N6P8Q0_NATCH|nr:hypothetical protein [Natrarchaeobius chitinivorans]RQG92505.1 hypothetical protein EA473_15925 [Natrarchaeobius chitinivorans]
MKTNRQPDDQRGQMYTLEGFAAAAIVLFALLFAMQSVVVAPGTGGAIDQTAQAQNQQELQDALVVAAHAEEGNGSLSELVRHWAELGYVDEEDFAEYFVLGGILEDHFSGSGVGDRYGVEFVYLNESENSNEIETETAPVMGSYTTDPSAVTASYTVTLHENQNMTEIDRTNGRIVDSGESIKGNEIPDGAPDTDHIYNVVEVRVTAW